MGKMTAVRTSDEGRSWLVDSDGKVICEVESDAFAATSLAPDSDKLIAVEVRAHAASHAYFTT
jgi:hypothetical protein